MRQGGKSPSLISRGWQHWLVTSRMTAVTPPRPPPLHSSARHMGWRQGRRTLPVRSAKHLFTCSFGVRWHVICEPAFSSRGTGSGFTRSPERRRVEVSLEHFTLLNSCFEWLLVFFRACSDYTDTILVGPFTPTFFCSEINDSDPVRFPYDCG